jgi:hypothetical protein
MNSLGLHEAAAFLRMHPEEVRRRARLGLLPGAKPGKRWVFIEADLADYLRSLYSPPRQALVGDRGTSCQSTNAEARGGLGMSRNLLNG